jgi:integrase
LWSVFASGRDCCTACAEFCILTATRSDETLSLTCEVNFQAALWTIPSERMKAGEKHQVPLSSRCIEILTRLRPVADSQFVFAGLTPQQAPQRQYDASGAAPDG